MNRAQLDRQPEEVASMFDDVAERYDLTNDVLSLGQSRRWRTRVVEALNPKRGEKILDLAAGTGTSSEPFADLGAEVIAGDISEGMLAVGRRRRPDIDFRYADATDLPFDDDTFDAVTISFGLRNVENTHLALTEMLRVTKPGGRLLICEFSTPVFSPFKVVYMEYLMRALPAIARKVSSNPEAYVYLAESIREWPHQEALALQMTAAGWRDAKFRNLSGGIVALHHAVKGAVVLPERSAGTGDGETGDGGTHGTAMHNAGTHDGGTRGTATHDAATHGTATRDGETSAPAASGTSAPATASRRRSPAAAEGELG